MARRFNPFDDAQVAARYDAWYGGPGRRADRLEKGLLLQLIADISSDFSPERSVLDIGCGTGHFTRWLAEQGFRATGVDISRSMLAEALRIGGAVYVQADALELPFDEDQFDIAALITTLEFVADPQRALAEAARVARHGLLLGALNRHSLLAARRRASGKAVWKAARFLTVSELAEFTKQACGSRLRTLNWRTTVWPAPCVGSLRIPWGGFIGMSVMLANSRRKPNE